MINELFRGLFKVVFFLLRWIFNILLLPILPLMKLLPGFTEFLEIAINFFDNYLLKAISFSREVFLNVTGFPQEIITISVDFALTLIGFIGILRLITFITNLWRTFKGGSTDG